MSLDKEAHHLFLKYKKALVKQFGNEPLHDTTINKIGKDNFGSHWGGAVANDSIRIAPNRYYVVNTAGHKSAGVHWMALRTTANHAYLYDSYNRNVHHLQPHLVKSLIRHGFQLGGTSHRPDQIGHTSQTCGDDSLAWLMVVRDLGIRRAAHV